MDEQYKYTLHAQLVYMFIHNSVLHWQLEKWKRKNEIVLEVETEIRTKTRTTKEIIIGLNKHTMQ